MAVKFIDGVGYIDSTCPTQMWPDKSCVWLRGFAEGWSFARSQPINAPLPIYQGKRAAGFRFGLGQFAILGKRSNATELTGSPLAASPATGGSDVE